MTMTSQIYIEATGTDPAVAARAAVGRAQQELLRTVRAQAALLELELGHDAREQAAAHLVGFCAQTVRGYLRACDQALYAAGAGAAETRLLVRALRVTAGLVDGQIDALSEAEEPATLRSAAEALEAVLAAHLSVEHDVLLPGLAALPGVELPMLVADVEVLRAGGLLDTPEVVDVREIPHGQRHPQIFARFARLTPGEGFTLVNNHDPKPLRREFEAAFPGGFTWDYLESGPQRWQVRVGRQADHAA
jgi:uncharacterized protein (DUF2249 family)